MNSHEIMGDAKAMEIIFSYWARMDTSTSKSLLRSLFLSYSGTAGHPYEGKTYILQHFVTVSGRLQDKQPDRIQTLKDAARAISTSKHLQPRTDNIDLKLVWNYYGVFFSQGSTCPRHS